MEKKTIYFIIALNFLIIMALSIFLYGIKKSNEGEIIIEQNKLVNVEMPKENVEKLKWEDYNVEFTYFNEFTNRVENLVEGSVYQSIGMFNKETEEGCTLMIYTGENEFESVKDLMYSLANGAKNNTNISNDTIKVYENAKFDKEEAFKLKYKNSDGINVYELVTIHDEKQYVFMYSAKDENYDENKAEFLFNNVKFLDN